MTPPGLLSRTTPAPTPRASAAVLRRRCACGGTPGPTGECEQCRRNRPVLQRSAVSAGPALAPSSVHRVLASLGRPLDAETRAFMEPRFGHSFADVLVHADGAAADSAREVGARAYAVGHHVVFGSGAYTPGTVAGRRLLAHELAHVVQQRGASAALQPSLEVGAEDDPAEREADRAADAALRGDAVSALPRGAMALRRTVATPIIEDPLPGRGAGACVVHLHGNEANARETAITLRQTHCVNLVRLDVPATDRTIRVEATAPDRTVGRRRIPAGPVSCEADPNRMFTPTGIRSHAFSGGCFRGDPRARAALETELTAFRDRVWMAIGRCRGGSGGATSGTLPVVAMHNNTPGDLSIDSYENIAGRSERGATERNPNRVGGTGAPAGTPVRPNPYHAPGQDPDDFLLTTETDDYDFFRRHGRNVVLQARERPLPLPPGSPAGTTPRMSPPPTDDGSLSVALGDVRYINVESEGKRYRGRATHAFVQSRTQALEALQSLGVGPQPCTPAPATGSGSGGATGTGTITGTGTTGPTTAPASGTAAATGTTTTTAPTAPVGPRTFDRNAPGMPQARARETTPPRGVPASCWFADQAALDARKAYWAGQIAAMTTTQVVMWIVGLNRPPADATRETDTHRACMERGLRAATAPSRGAGRVQTPITTFVQSPYRGYAEPHGGQEAIWERKYRFTGAPFDRISDRARRACPSLPAADLKWTPGNPVHENCWHNVLGPADRQREILEASSAPGISRHHWGTDVDLLDPVMNPAEWMAGRTYADAYSWLVANAASYGFIQTYTTLQPGGTGYMEERWHWSYYPIAQALLEFARAHQADIEAELTVQWQGREQYSYVQQHWREYMFNVNQAGVF